MTTDNDSTTAALTTTSRSMIQTLVSYPTLLQHEIDLKGNPHSVSKWCLYLHDIHDLLLEDSLLQKAQCWVGERAVALLPGSYKLWRLHLSNLKQQNVHKDLILEAYKKCLVRLHKSPRIWLEYLDFLIENFETQITLIRNTFDQSLQALAVTQHDKIWKPYLDWVSSSQKIPAETTLRVWRRAVLYDFSKKEEFALQCIKLSKWNEACGLYLDLLNNTTQVSPLGTTRHDLWITFCNLCTRHASLKVDFDSIIRAALPNRNNNKSDEATTSFDKLLDTTTNKDDKLFLGEMEGTLWTKLADYHVRLGEFDLARSIYEEALESVVKVRDFSIIFDAYVKFEEGIIEAMMELQDEEEEEEVSNQEEDGSSNDWDILLGQDSSSSTTNMADMELALARAEHLTTVRRPLLLNRVLLRQNPHNVGEWIKRADLFLGNNQKESAAAALEEALSTVQAKRAVNGLVYTLVTKLASEIYKEEPAKARRVYERVCQEDEYEFARIEDLAQCYAAWVELELSLENWDDALGICRRATSSSSSENKVVRNLFRSIQLWDLLLDLEESLGTVQTTKDAYNRALDLKVATPLHVINYATFLQDQKYFEESFAAYERGVELFNFPASKVLWSKYLKAFVERYKGTKMERARDLFERCLESCPPEISSEFFMLQGELEEEYGLTKRALGVYDKMCQTVPVEEKHTAYRLLIAKTQLYLGIPATRNVYQQAIENLPDRPAAEMCLEFAKTETLLHEMDRARAVLKYGAQLADPRRHAEYWKTWHDFEVANGNEETFRDMLRVKRSVQAAFSTVNYNAAEMGGGATEQGDDTLTDEQALSMIAEREGVEVDNKTRIGGFVQAKRTAELAELGEVESRVAKLRKATAHVDVKQQQQSDEAAAGRDDDDEIDLDEEEGEDQEEPSTTEAVRSVSTKAVPSAVFGGLKGDDVDPSQKKMGALERLRAAAASRTSGTGSSSNDSPQ